MNPDDERAATNEEVDALYARLEALTAENDRLTRERDEARALCQDAQYAKLMVLQTETLVRALAAERDMRTVRAAIAPTAVNVRALAESGSVASRGKPLHEQVRRILAAINERAKL